MLLVFRESWTRIGRVSGRFWRNERVGGGGGGGLVCETTMRTICSSSFSFVLCPLVVLVVICSNAAGSGASSDSDARALGEFYDKIDAPKDILGNWDIAGTAGPCKWAGVGCDTAGNVIKLNLNGSRLKGTISEAVGNITNLVELDLSNNYFTGPIPRSIVNLQRLANFSAGSNNLSHSIPDDLGSAGSLVHVDLSFNQLSGGIPSGICLSPGLKVLTLTNNTLTGAIFANMSKCQSLERLFLGTNSLQGAIPSAIGELGSLISLDLSRNSFTGAIPETFGQSRMLTYLSLASNRLRGTIPPSLGRLGSLKGMLLNENNLKGSIPPHLGNLTNLEVLDLSGNELSGMIPPDLGRLTMLTTLKLRKNRLSGKIPSSLRNCSLLLDLELGENNLTGAIPAEMGGLSLLTYGLNLSWNGLTGPIPQELGQLQNLMILDLSHNELQGRVPPSLENLRSLLIIDLAFNSLNGSLPNFRPNMANASEFEGNPALCGPPLAACDRSGKPVSRHSGGAVHMWAAVIAGIGVALVLVVLGSCGFCYWRLRYGYAPTDAESAEGRLFVDDDKPLAFNFEQLVEATQLISMAAPVGKGRFSTVYKVVMPSGQEIAVKKLKVDAENSSLTRKFTSELQKIDKMQHQNLLTLLGYILQGDSLLLVYDFCPNGSLGEWLHRRPESVLEWSIRYKIAVGAAQGLAFLHHNVHPPFIHRDVNSNNILLDATFEPLIGDVGLAKLYDPSKETESMTDVAGSFGYIAPEYAYTMRVTEKSNVYSFGVILLEILSGKRPVEPSFGEGCDLVSWVRTAPQRSETPEQLLDSRVSTASFSVRQEMLQVLSVAKLCTSAPPSERPKMKTVVEMLQKAKISGGIGAQQQQLSPSPLP